MEKKKLNQQTDVHNQQQVEVKKYEKWPET